MGPEQCSSVTLRYTLSTLVFWKRVAFCCVRITASLFSQEFVLDRSCVTFSEVLDEDIHVLVGKSLADGAKTTH